MPFINKENSREKKSTRLVGIGVPVFNGAATIAKTLDSLLAQTFTDFEILISDNCSSDETATICQRYAQKDMRIVYVKQSENRGIGWNFNYVLNESKGRYFMWASADDIWDKDFIAENLKSFEANDTIIGSMSKFKFLDGSEPPMNTYPLMGSMVDNILKYLKAPYFQYCVHSLFKRDILVRCFDNVNFFGHDWEITIKTLVYGKYQVVDKVLFFKGRQGLSTKGIMANLQLNATRAIDRILPMTPLTLKILREGMIPASVKWRCLPLLLFYNFKFSLSLVKERIVCVWMARR